MSSVEVEFRIAFLRVLAFYERLTEMMEKDENPPEAKWIYSELKQAIEGAD